MFLRLCTVCVAASLIGGCKKSNSSGSSPSGKPIIAVVPKGQLALFWQSVHAGAVRGAKESGVEVSWNGPQAETDMDAQIRIIDDMLAKGVKAFVLAPQDRDQLNNKIEAIHKRMPIVIMDSGCSTKDYTSFVATNNRRGGEMAGEEMLRLIGNGSGEVAMIRNVPGAASTTEREDGFKAAIAKNANVKLVDEPFCNGDAGVAAEKAGALMVAHPNLAGFFGSAEPAAVGIQNALVSNNKAGKLKFVGFDAGKDLKDGLDAGRIDALVVQDPVEMGRLAVVTAAKALKGEEVPREQPMEPTLVTQQNKSDPKIKLLLTPDISTELQQ